MSKQIHNLIIIGSGPAGLTAAIYAARANLKPVIIEGKSPGGQLMGTTYVENWPGEKKILGPELMQKMRDHAQHFDCTFIPEEVVDINVARRPFTLKTHRGNEFQAHSVIIATGTVPKPLNIPGEKEFWGKGVTTCAVCDGAFYPDKEVIIVGGGDTAMEDASFMTKFTDKITIVHILDKLTACHAMQERVLNNPKIKIIYNSSVSEIRGNDQGLTEAVITNKQTGETQTLKTAAVFVAIGLEPKTQLFKDKLAMNRYGYIQTTDFTKTSVEGVFAAGDVADEKYKQAITSAGTGCMAALDAQRYLSELKLD